MGLGAAAVAEWAVLIGVCFVDVAAAADILVIV